MRIDELETNITELSTNLQLAGEQLQYKSEDVQARLARNQELLGIYHNVGTPCEELQSIVMAKTSELAQVRESLANVTAVNSQALSEAYLAKETTEAVRSEMGERLTEINLRLASSEAAAREFSQRADACQAQLDE